MPILPTVLSNWRAKKHRRQRRAVEARQRRRHGSQFDLAFRKTLCHRPRDRQRRRCRQPVGHGGRRSLRVRRYQGRRARRQASGDGRGDRPPGAGPCDRRPCGDGRDLCLGRRRAAGARRADAGQGCPQGRTARRGTDAWAGRSAREVVDAPVLQNAVASGSVLRPGETDQRDQGGVPRREGRRAGAARQGCRPRRREGRHARRARIR